MRILHVIGTLNPRSGGPAATVAHLNRFCSHGTVNEVATLDDPNADFLAELAFPVSALGPALLSYGYTPKLLPWLELNGGRFDGVVIHGLWQYCGYAVQKVFGGRKPYMVFTHGMLDPYFKHAYPLKHAKKWLYWMLVEHWVLRGAYRVLFTCDEEERLAAQSFSLHRWTAHTIPLGASPPERGDNNGRSAFLNLFPELEDRRYLLFLGRIDRKKGCDLLIKAFIRAAGLDPSLYLVMAGPDERSWHVELASAVAQAGLSSRVHWTGMLHGDEKWDALAGCEAFILPSHQENFGIAVIEALACGKPVLLSDKVNIASDIAGAGAGMVEADTEEGTFRLITGWIAMSGDRRTTMSVAASHLFDSRYDLRNQTQDLANLLRKSLQTKDPLLQSVEPVAK